MATFVAIDVETANEDMASICQIGVARFRDGVFIDSWSSLIDPEDDFSGFNVRIHGIEPEMVAGMPAFPAVAEHVRTLLTDTVSICHTHFDRVALECAASRYRLANIAADWVDSARIARRAWKECAWKGYGLANVCKRIGYQFKHHDALEDAKAAGFVLLAAIKETGLDLDQWRVRIAQPIDPDAPNVARDGNPDGDLFGDVIVFTGALSMPRREAAELAAGIGCTVTEGVTKKTTILVVGDQDLSKLVGYDKSSKHRKAEQMIAEGAQIRILRESDFRVLLKSAHQVAI